MPGLGSGAVASFVPDDPVRLLVLAHGYPWPDGSRSDSDLVEYARAAVERWAPFAEAHHAILVAPAFGGRDFAGYREMRGRRRGSDEFVNDLVAKAGAHMRRFRGTFSIHGHSAGAQFAARYLVTHPERLEDVVLSAPSTYPFPDRSTRWPNGMAAATSESTSSRAGGSVPGGLSAFTPRPGGWLVAASEVFVTVLAGSRDSEPRPAAPGQPGSTRIERAVAWVESMRRYAEAHHRASTIRFVLAEGLDHDEAAMASPAQEILARRWGTTSGNGGQ